MRAPGPVPGAGSAPSKRKHRGRWLVAAALVAGVAAAVGAHLALSPTSTRGSQSSTTSTPASGALTTAAVAAAIASATAATSYRVVSAAAGPNSSPETFLVTPNGFAATVGSGEELIVAGGQAYFTGPELLQAIGVTPSDAANRTGWYSEAVQSPDVDALETSLRSLGTSALLDLSDTTVTSASSTAITVQGRLPAVSGLNPGLNGTSATMTVSRAAALPTALTFSSGGELVRLTFSGWNSTTLPGVPSGAGSLAALVHPSGEQALLSTISLQQRDVPAGYRVDVIPGGEEVAGQVTLDLCNAAFASESQRVDRRQVEIAGPAVGSFSVSTEAVVYADSAATAIAFEEVEAATAHCQGGTVRAIGTGGSPWSTVAGVDRIAYEMTVPQGSDPPFVSDIVYIRRGRILVGLYFYTSSANLPVAVAGQTSVAGAVRVFEERLADLPASAVA